MDRDQIVTYFSNLSDTNQQALLTDLNRSKIASDYSVLLTLRGDALDDKRAECPYCKNFNFVKNGKDKGCRKYKCKDCNGGFTEYTGTWINGIHKKHLIPLFMKTLESSLSLVKSSKEVGISEPTVFSWRHKFLSSQDANDDDEKPFKGITEVDETFYHHSQKGKKCIHRDARNRGGRSSRGITNEEATVLTTMDRAGNSQYQFTNMGRLSLVELENAIGNRITERTILCSDGHNSYKALAKKQEIEHHILNASKKQRVKGEYHIQHINSLHSRMKNFFNYQFRGVSTKYLQKYLNWQMIKDQFKDSTQWIKTMLTRSLQRADALNIYKNIEKNYLKIYKSSQLIG
ncbi:IS1595 family transposase [Polaribacter sp. IC063]|uniref:IS1595 family transposase n=1 Tax=Polaribacter sp. IC063 TaxID=57031 RepID=UPI0011BF7AC1|nr:IS1595 family transposase [Polaribacter sp. IC063]TXD49530.1 IS1595 family transposase [Polaribacter sp. IC063]